MLMLDNVRRFYAEAKRASSIALGSSETFAALVVVYISATHKRWTSECENLVSIAFLCPCD